MDEIRKTCVVCGMERVKPMVILEQKGTPHHHNDHNFVHTYKILSRCVWCEHSQIEEYSHDCFGYFRDEAWDLWWWYVFTPDDTTQLRQIAERCTAPLDTTVACSIREALQTAVGKLWGGAQGTPHRDGKADYVMLRLINNDNLVRFEIAK